ncbi:flagellar basal body rod protein FlgB [Pleionea sediminis]|uniref:flagellar basal body rod protein FlgB n=1 Tax=Pleionea sediminis TaxID=2569479 RepID=UPI00118690EE|nr:flagellar basal body rod protein FlgB [Pleionea sediminis]
MAINFDKALGIQQYTLALRSQRAEILANNMANADTPGYKAQDIDFKRALENAMSGKEFGLRRTDKRHFNGGSGSLAHGDVKYRVPNQPDTGDGNTVDAQKEMQKYAQNAIDYQTTLLYLSNKFKGITKALKGE